jgi:hypothetical protein
MRNQGVEQLCSIAVAAERHKGGARVHKEKDDFNKKLTV